MSMMPYVLAIPPLLIVPQLSTGLSIDHTYTPCNRACIPYTAIRRKRNGEEVGDLEE
jgi:hypothetical protein